jgi:hypothetical protein
MNDPEKWASIQTAIERAVEKLNLAMTDDEELKRIVYANTVCIQSNGNTNSKPSSDGVETPKTD